MKLEDKDFRNIVENIANPIWMSDKDGLKVYYNKAWTYLTGKTAINQLGEEWLNSIHPEDVERVIKNYVAAVKAEKAFTFEYRVRRVDGEYRWIRDNGNPIFDQNGKLEGFVGNCIDLTEKHEAIRAVPMSDSDVVTGLISRDRFRIFLTQEIERTNRYDAILSIMYIDLDNFGEINEMFGFESGNEVLKIVAEIVAANIRGIDLACRYNGDIYVVALPETSIYDAEIVAERIRSSVETMGAFIQGKPARLRASIGISQYNEGTSMENFILCAERAKDHARKIGGNRVQKLELF